MMIVVVDGMMIVVVDGMMVVAVDGMIWNQMKVLNQYVEFL